MHCPGHQKGEKPIALGNTKEDQESRKAALNKTERLVLEQQQPDRQPEQLPLGEPELVAQTYLEHAHQLTHVGRNMAELFRRSPFQVLNSPKLWIQ